MVLEAVSAKYHGLDHQGAGAGRVGQRSDHGRKIVDVGQTVTDEQHSARSLGVLAISDPRLGAIDRTRGRGASRATDHADQQESLHSLAIIPLISQINVTTFGPRIPFRSVGPRTSDLGSLSSRSLQPYPVV